MFVHDVLSSCLHMLQYLTEVQKQDSYDFVALQHNGSTRQAATCRCLQDHSSCREADREKHMAADDCK